MTLRSAKAQVEGGRVNHSVSKGVVSHGNGGFCMNRDLRLWLVSMLDKARRD